MDSRKKGSRGSSQKSSAAPSVATISPALSQESLDSAHHDNRGVNFETPDDVDRLELEQESDYDNSDTEPVVEASEQKDTGLENPQENNLLNMEDIDVGAVTERAQGDFEHDDDAETDRNIKGTGDNEDGENLQTNEPRSTEEEEEIDATVPGKKTSRKPKKKVEKRTAFDGRDVVFVTECTQTDWKWKDKIEKAGKGKIITPRSDIESTSGKSETGLKSILVKPESREAVSRTLTEGESTMDTRTATDLTPFSLQPNDEYGIPLMDMSSDSDSSDDEAPKKVKTHRHHLPTIGPPQILKYVRESDRMGKDTDRTSSDLDDEHQMLESADLLSSGNSPGMFGGVCEFCGSDIKPFPSLDQQLSLPPESLYCCEDYREFVEFAMTTANKLEEDVAKKNEKISIKVHPHHGSKQARKMAKEQAVQRMRERELQRRQQEATGMQAAYFNSSFGSSTMTARSEEAVAPEVTTKKKKKKQEGGGGGKKDGDKKGEGGKHGEKSATASDATGGAGHAGGHSGGHDGAHGTAGGVPGLSYGPGGSVSGYMGPEVARQMKTINYQLSSQRCLEEGWTLRAPSPLDMDDLDTEVFIPEPLHPAMIASGKLHDRKLIEKFYPDGTKFLTMFPDGTGNIFYPSGHLAILILSISLGQFTYLVYDDGDNPELLATFCPTGIGCCHFANGKIRLNYDQMEGLELDINGGKKRLWNWKDQEVHVHAPPFQPIVFGMNRHVGVRFMAQDSIALTLTGKKRSCRFNVGAKLKLVSPENMQPKLIDENHLFIDERKVRVDAILDKISTLLKFPKSPKVDRILPPLSIKSRQQKVDKMKKELSSAAQTQNTGKKSKKVVKQARLSPLPVISVN